MNKDLFTPTINIKDNITEEAYTYYKMGLVAFFGGFIPTILLVKDNCELLRISEQKTKLIVAIGIIAFVLKYIILIVFTKEIIVADQRIVRYVNKLFVLIYLAISYQMLKVPYKRHFMLAGKEKPILKIALLYIIAGIFVEILLVTLIGAMI